MGKTFNASVDWLGMVENPDQDVNPSVNGEKAQRGFEILQDASMRNKLGLPPKYSEEETENFLRNVNKPVSHALDILGTPGNIMAEIAEGAFNYGDQEFNFSDAMPGFSGDYSFTNMYGEPTKTVSDVTGVEGFVPGLALDILTDPTTYIGAGLLKSGVKGTLKGGARKTGEKIAKNLSYDDIMKLPDDKFKTITGSGKDYWKMVIKKNPKFKQRLLNTYDNMWEPSDKILDMINKTKSEFSAFYKSPAYKQRLMDGMKISSKEADAMIDDLVKEMDNATVRFNNSPLPMDGIGMGASGSPTGSVTFTDKMLKMSDDQMKDLIRHEFGHVSLYGGARGPAGKILNSLDTPKVQKSTAQTWNQSDKGKQLLNYQNNPDEIRQRAMNALNYMQKNKLSVDEFMDIPYDRIVNNVRSGKMSQDLLDLRQFFDPKDMKNYLNKAFSITAPVGVGSTMFETEKYQEGEEIMLPEVEVSALSDESYNKLSDPQKQIYDSFVTPDGIAQTVDIGNNDQMHWEDALKMTDDLGVRNIYNEPSTVGQMFPSTFNIHHNNFRPHVNPVSKNVYVPKLIKPGDDLYYDWTKNMINDLKLGEESWVKQMSEQERLNKIHRLRTSIEDAYRRIYFKDIIAEFAHIPEFWRSESFYNIPKSFMNDAMRFIKGEEMDHARYQDKDHYEYKTHNAPNSFEKQLREKYKMQDGGPKSEREKYIKFALDTESGYHYIRNKDSAVKKLGSDGKWDGKTYYKIYEDGKYYPHYVGDEKRATIGHGHAPNDRDIYEEYKDGINETQALDLLGKDIDEKLRLSEIYYNSRFGDDKWKDLTESEQFMLNDYTFNVRGGFHKTFKNFAKAIHDKDYKLAKQEYKRALGERNVIFMERYLKPWMDIQQEKTTIAPPLEDMPLPIGTYPIDMTKPQKKETSWWRGEEGWIPDELELPWFMDGAGINARGNTPSSVTDIPATADGSRAENATMSRSVMDPMPSLNNDLTINDNLALDNTISDLSEETTIPQVKYGGQYMWGLDLRSTKAQAGKEVKSDDIYANDRYSQSATKYKRMLPKYRRGYGRK